MDADALLAATYRGEPRAFESLVRSQAGRLHRIAARVTGDGTLADDVLQETFLRILRVPPAARPSRSAEAWLARVTVRVALNILDSERARRRREERYAMQRSREMVNGAPSRVALPQDFDRPVAEALASLSPETRAALWLHVVEGQRVREVAACLDSSRSAVSRRIRAGLEALRACLARSGFGLAGVASLRGALRGAEVPPPEAVVRRILEAGWTAMAAGAASSPVPDALDAALAAPARSLPSSAGIAAAAFITIGVLAAVGGHFLLRTGSDRGKELVGPIVAAPAVLPANGGPGSWSENKSIEPAPPSPVTKPAVVAGTVRDENDEPISSADVYLALHPPAEKEMGQDVLEGRFFRADYYKRSGFLRTKTDGEGRFIFEGVRDSGEATLSAFKEDHSGGGDRVKIEEGSRSEVHLVLADGMTLTGSVSAGDGSPVADAVVSVCQAWSRTDHIFRGGGLGLTDADGRFRLGLGAGTTACHLRVNSESQGQHFFPEVQVTDEDVELILEEPAAVKGTITWSDGTPASGLTVRATGRLPEPPIPVSRAGVRPTAVHDGLVGGDGSYVIQGLHPRLAYDIFVIDGSLGERKASMHPLSPRFINCFTLGPGDVKVWDHAVPRPITIRGRIRTERTGTPLPEGQVGVRKDGKRLSLISIWADGEGFFEAHLNTGSGEYVLHAEPPVGAVDPEQGGDLIAERFGKTLHLESGQEVELDLTIFEPLVFPIRVLDPAGAPAKSISAQLSLTFPDGQKMSREGPCTLDDTGRTSFLLYFPATELWCGVSALPGAPAAETRRYAGIPGTVLPEETITLPRTCDLVASIQDATGKACAEQPVYLHVDYEDGSKADLGCRTDKAGALREKGRVRAAAFVLEIHSADSKATWKSQRLDGSAGEALDLGEIVLAETDG